MTERSRSASATSLSLWLACAALPAQEGKPATRLEGARIQLSEHLAEARITSPLLGLEPASNPAELDSDRDVLLEESFEDFDWGFAGWAKVSQARIEPEGEGSVLRLDAPADAFLGWVLPVRPDAFYHFERAARVEGEPFCDWVVVESREELESARLDTRGLFLPGRGAALKVHPLPMRSGEESKGEWQRASTHFYPSPRTRALVVLIRPRVGADPNATVRGTWFDEVRLEEVVPDRKARIRLLKAANLAPGADPSLGVRKAGWLLPLCSPEGRQAGEAPESNYAWREALYAPPDTEFAFDLRLSAGARLRLATGLARETPPGAAARFQVELFGSGGEKELLLDTVRTARMEEWHWEELELDLSARAGQDVTLVLRTRAEKGDPHPLWADPRLESPGKPGEPLVILIAVDTLRADRLSSYGYSRPTTPALDRLAAEGVRFDQARSNCNWTCPSFASIFTGLVPSRHGVTSYGPATPLPDELVTLAEHFQVRGFATRSIAYKVPLFDGHYEQGFDQAFNVPRDEIRGEENLARALEWLEAHRGGPSFLFLHFNDPHQPFVQPPPYESAFGPGPESLGLTLPVAVPSGAQAEHVRLFRDLYDGAVAYVDACIGRFLEALRERGLYSQATIAFVADHGEQLWEHGRFGHGGEDLYDEIVRVPLIVKPPKGSFEPGRVVQADVSGFDVMPTLLELARIPPQAKLDARSLVPLLQGKAEGLERVVVTETSLRGLALVEGGYKYVLSPGARAEALFHLRSDPLEQKDLLAEQPQVAARMRELVIAYLLEHRPGSFLLARATGPTRLAVSTRAVRTLVGPQIRPDSGDAQASSVELPAGTWALFEVEAAPETPVTVEGLEAQGSAGFEPWNGRSLAALGAAGVWRVHGPEPARAADQGTVPVDEELLEDLRRLGYAE